MELKPSEAVAWWSTLFGIAGFVSTQWLAKKLEREVSLSQILFALGIITGVSLLMATVVARR